MANLITGIISLAVSVALLSNVFIANAKGVNQSGQGCYNTSASFVFGGANHTCPNAFSTSESAMWGLLTLIGIVGLVYGVLNVFGLT